MENPVLKQKNLKRKITDEIATRKRALKFYTLANILPDPDIVLRKQGKDINIYKELLCDSHVFACIQSRKSGVLSLEWDINRGLDKDENAEEIEKLLKKLDIHKLISDILDATQFGFQPLEIMWERDKSGHVLPARQNLLNGFVLMMIIISNSELKRIIMENYCRIKSFY